MVKNKKSQVLMYGLIFGLIGAIIVTLIAGPKTTDIIGSSSIKIISAQKWSEKLLSYTDASANLAFQNSIISLAEKGGISEVDITGLEEEYSLHECGKYKGAMVWAYLEKGEDSYQATYCFEKTSPMENFELEFSSELNSHLESSPYTIPLNNYQINFSENSIIGIAVSPIIIPIYDRFFSEEESIKNQQENPKEITQFSREYKNYGQNTPQNLMEFTGTAICAKGSSCILTEDALNLAVKAQEIANSNGKAIEIYSAYRSSQKQELLWNGKTPEKYAQRYPDESMRRKYVCDPKGGENSCPHLSAKVVDARFRGKTAGTMTSSDWAELEKIMYQAGWVRYANEPWHFECCNTPRYERAKNEEEMTGEPVMAIV